MRVVLILLILIFSGCFKNNLTQTVEKLENNKNKRCFYSIGTDKKLLKNDIYQQILSEINTFVNSNFSIKQYLLNKKSNEIVTQNINTSSFGFIEGVDINYKKEGDKILAYTCLSIEKFNNLRRKNLEKVRKFFKLLREYQLAIELGDKHKIEKVRFEINSEFPNIKNKYLEELNKKAKNLVSVNVYLQTHEVSVGDLLNIVIYADKPLYAYFILKTPQKSYLLKKSLILSNRQNKLKLLISKKGEIFVYFTKSPLYIDRFLLSSNELSDKFYLYVDKFKQSNYLKIVKLDLSIKNPSINKVCIKSNRFIYLIENEMSIDNEIDCKNYQYLIKINVRKVDDGYIFRVKVNNNYFSLYKRFNIRDRKYLKEVVIPELVDKINSYLK